jgi:hypothetical protein
LVEEGLIKRLMASIKCGVCGHRYEVDNINVLSHDQDLWFLSASCLACHTRCLIAAIVREGKVPEVITDLTEAELVRFRNTGKLTADDVLEMHNFLKNFDGDFSQLFSRK